MVWINFFAAANLIGYQKWELVVSEWFKALQCLCFGNGVKGCLVMGARPYRRCNIEVT